MKEIREGKQHLLVASRRSGIIIASAGPVAGGGGREAKAPPPPRRRHPRRFVRDPAALCPSPDGGHGAAARGKPEVLRRRGLGIAGPSETCRPPARPPRSLCFESFRSCRSGATERRPLDPKLSVVRSPPGRAARNRRAAPHVSDGRWVEENRARAERGPRLRRPCWRGRTWRG